MSTRFTSHRSSTTVHAAKHHGGDFEVGDIVRRSDISSRNQYVIVDIKPPWIFTRRISGSGGPGIVTFPTSYMLERVS